jgi:hypothetical protein
MKKSFDDYMCAVTSRIRRMPRSDKLLEKWGVGVGQFCDCYDEGLSVSQAAKRIYQQLEHTDYVAKESEG